MPSRLSWRRTLLMRVVFPAPDGPETMNNVPSGWKLLDILDLLADSLDLGFQVYNKGSDVRRPRLQSHGVDLADHLLGEEVELLARRFLAVDRLLRLLDVVREARELLGDVALLDHQHDFLREAVFADGDIAGGRGNIGDARAIRREQLIAHELAPRGELFLRGTHVLEACRDVVVQRLTLADAHRHELREGVADQRGDLFLLLVADLALDRLDLQQVGHAHQIGAAERARDPDVVGDRAQLRHDGVRDLRVDADVVFRLLRTLHANGDIQLAARERLGGERPHERLELPEELRQ